jgi:hypothetical protein
MKNQLFKELYEATIQQIEIVKKISIEYDMLNEDEYLEFQTRLNELSLDDY